MSLGKLWPAANCYALYHLENTSDSSGHSRTLTNSGASFSSAKFGVGALLNRSVLAYMYRQEDFSINKYAEDWSVSGWVCARALPINTILHLWFFSGTDESEITAMYYYTSGLWYLRILVNSSAAIYPISLTVGAWHHIAVTNVGSTHMLSIYFDGCRLGTITQTSHSNGLNTFNIGLKDSPGIDGYLDEFAIYSKTLTAQEIRRYYAWAMGKL